MKHFIIFLLFLALAGGNAALLALHAVTAQELQLRNRTIVRLELQFKLEREHRLWAEAVVIEQQRWLDRTNHPELVYVGE
jgi:hypothetical protein